MNSLIENGLLTEIQCGTNFSYIINDSNNFLLTEYKVLQSQVDSCFIKCMKMTNNGKTTLYYLTSGYKSLASMMATLDAEHFLTIVGNLFVNIMDAKNNGFLSCQNIDISFEKIFIDPATYKVSFIYLPLSQSVYEDYISFENEIRTSLIKLINGIAALSAPKTIQLSADLANGTMTLSDLCNRIKGGRVPMTYTPQSIYANQVVEGKMRIVAMNTQEHMEIPITKNSFLIGKNESQVDAAISFNKAISRVHCRIDKTGNRFIITDLNSANGTYVNKVKLAANKPCPIDHGDVIRLADNDFQVVIY